MSDIEDMELITLNRTLSFLLLGQKGGENRVKVIELLSKRPFNINQLAAKLDLNYRTVKHHINLLLKHELISSSKTGGYGDVYFLSPQLEGNMQLFNKIIQKMDTVHQLADFTETPHFFKDVMRKTSDGVIIVDVGWDVFFWNESASRIFGYKNEDILHWPLNIFFDKSSFNIINRELVKHDRVDNLDTNGKNILGDRIDISLTIDSIKNGEKKVIGYSILVRDISEKKRIEAKIKIKKDILEIIMENANIGIAYLTDDFKFIIVNTLYAIESGHRKDELIGRNHFDIFPNKENEAIFLEVRNSGESKEVFDKPYSFLDQPERGITYWNWALVPIKDDYGKVTSLVLTLKETTSRVKSRKKRIS